MKLDGISKTKPKKNEITDSELPLQGIEPWATADASDGMRGGNVTVTPQWTC